MAVRRLCAAAVLLIALASSSRMAAVDGVTDNVITQWNFVTQRVVRTLSVPTQIGDRVHALVHISQYKALQLAQWTFNAHPEAAAAYAAHYVLSTLFPAQQSPIFDLVIADQIYPLHLTLEQDNDVQEIALKFAVPLLAQRVFDGSQKWAKFKLAPPGSPPGQYQFIPGQTIIAFPQLATTRPFVIRSPKDFDIFGGPYKVPSSGYDADYNQMATIGNANSTAQTSYQKDTARFWEYGGGTSGIVGELFNVSLEIAGPDLSLKDTARLFAWQSVAAYDAFISAWYQKHKYLFWRPITAFRQGDLSHSPDFDFTPVLISPPEPEYLSGHASNGGCWSAVISLFVGRKITDTVPPFVATTEAYSLPSRSYDTIGALGEEIAMSRVYAGIHFPKAIHDGFQLGMQVGEFVVKNFEFIFGHL